MSNQNHGQNNQNNQTRQPESVPAKDSPLLYGWVPIEPVAVSCFYQKSYIEDEVRKIAEKFIGDVSDVIFFEERDEDSTTWDPRERRSKCKYQGKFRVIIPTDNENVSTKTDNGFVRRVDNYSKSFREFIFLFTGINDPKEYGNVFPREIKVWNGREQRCILLDPIKVFEYLLDKNGFGYAQAKGIRPTSIKRMKISIRSETKENPSDRNHPIVIGWTVTKSFQGEGGTIKDLKWSTFSARKKHHRDDVDDDETRDNGDRHHHGRDRLDFRKERHNQNDRFRDKYSSGSKPGDKKFWENSDSVDDEDDILADVESDE